MRTNRSKCVTVLGGLVVVVLLLVSSQPIAEQFRFWRLFESMGTNDQGCFEYRHRQTGIVMVRIPGGTFMMGSREDEDETSQVEYPRHSVRLSPFLIAKCEVNQSVWNAVMSGKAGTSGMPAYDMTWQECEEFLTRTGLELPTEAQWERACRGGTTTRYWFGETTPARRVNAGDDAPHEIDGPTANPFGLLNVHDSVWELCADGFDEGFYSTDAALEHDPVCRTMDHGLVIRGGAHADGFARSAERRCWNFGTRVRSGTTIITFTASPASGGPIHVGLRPAFWPLP